MADPATSSEETKAEPTPAPVATRTEERKRALPPLTEEQLDSPSRNTLIPLFVVFAVTALSWGSARFACNMHPPESRSPPKLTTDKLAGTPKDAAIEAVQRWDSHDYDGALELAAGDAAVELQAAQANCRAHANDCARDREASAGLLTEAAVMRSDGNTADADVTTRFKGATKKYRVHLVRETLIWKVTTRAAE